MRRVLVIGIGAGDPAYVTVQAVAALNRADVFLLLDKGGDKEDLVALRREICGRYVTGHAYRFLEVADVARDLSGPSYDAAVGAWHEQRLDLVERMLLDHVGEDECVGLLVWGDPSLYDSTLRVLDELLARGRVAFEHEVIPGVSALHALTARHRIPLNRVGGSVLITSGRGLAAAVAAGHDDVVVMLDGEGAYTGLDGDDFDIWWGAYLGTPDELLVAGRLSEVGGRIREARAEARARKGWMFDTYLVRRVR